MKPKSYAKIEFETFKNCFSMKFTGASVLFYLVWGDFIWKVTNGTENPAGMEDYLWEHQVKKTYCGLVQKQRVYQQENLEVYCAAKVKFFLDQVK